jgi:hypothetical protein
LRASLNAETRRGGVAAEDFWESGVTLIGIGEAEGAEDFGATCSVLRASLNAETRRGGVVAEDFWESGVTLEEVLVGIGEVSSAEGAEDFGANAGPA